MGLHIFKSSPSLHLCLTQCLGYMGLDALQQGRWRQTTFSIALFHRKLPGMFIEDAICAQIVYFQFFQSMWSFPSFPHFSSCLLMCLHITRNRASKNNINILDMSHNIFLKHFHTHDLTRMLQCDKEIPGMSSRRPNPWAENESKNAKV